MSSSHQTLPASSPGVGEQLRLARLEAGLTLAEAAARLRNAGPRGRGAGSRELGPPGRPVFVRGQLRSYLRLLQLPQTLADTVRDAVSVQPPALIPRTFTPPMQRMLDRAMGRAVYVVITALIAVPVWVATRSHVDDSRPVETASLGLGAGDVNQPARPVRPTPVTASLGAMPKRNRDVTPPVAEGATQAVSTADLLLRFTGDSWIEVTGPDGAALEQALVPAGEERRFAAGSVARVKLGNADDVEVTARR